MKIAFLIALLLMLMSVLLVVGCRTLTNNFQPYTIDTPSQFTECLDNKHHPKLIEVYAEPFPILQWRCT